jgi:hypothetical protein
MTIGSRVVGTSSMRSPRPRPTPARLARKNGTSLPSSSASFTSRSRGQPRPQRGSRVARRAAQSRRRRNSLDQTNSSALADACSLFQQSRGPPSQVFRPVRNVSRLQFTRRLAGCQTVASARQSDAPAASQDNLSRASRLEKQRIIDRDRRHQRLDLVIPIRAAREHLQEQVDLGRRKNLDLGSISANVHARRWRRRQ